VDCSKTIETKHPMNDFLLLMIMMFEKIMIDFSSIYIVMKCNKTKIGNGHFCWKIAIVSPDILLDR
jgi:hypothetical protein